MFWFAVWAIFCISFQVAVLIAFVLIGIASFKRTTDQMYLEACTCRYASPLSLEPVC